MIDEKNNKNSFFLDYSNLMLTINKLSKSAENPFFKSGYVPLKDILNEVKRVCLDNNFIFFQKLGIRDSKNILETIITHKDGAAITGKAFIITKDENDPQKVGAGITYMRRYSLTAMFGIEEEDDDGNMASKTKKKVVDTNPIPPAQRTQENTSPFEEPRYVKPKSNEKIEGQLCSDCGKGKIIKNPKTGKLFCSEKCWLNK